MDKAFETNDIIEGNLNQNSLFLECILCSNLFSTVSHDIQPLLRHLLEIHKFIIGSPEEIADIRGYLQYWKKLRHEKLEEYCIIYITNTAPEDKAQPEKFFMLCDKLPEDKRLRDTLKEEKLKSLLRQKEKELEDKNFSRRCIYCSLTIEGGVSKSLKHLYSDHGFSMGNPDNIVFGAQLLDKLEHKLKKLVCLHCEKTFKNHNILREHMRKKQHRSLNPRNKEYDKFYLINYLKPGLPWEKVKKEVIDGENCTTGDEPRCSEVIDDEDVAWTDWQDEETSQFKLKCLFCSRVSSDQNLSELFCHMRESHSFDFEVLTKGLDFYSKVKIVNFMRRQVESKSCIGCQKHFDDDDGFEIHLSSTCSSFASFTDSRIWHDPLYLIPVLENDGILFYLDDEVEQREKYDDEESSSSSLCSEVVLAEDHFFLPSILTDSKLRHELGIEMDASTPVSLGGSRGMHTCRSRMVFRCLFCPFVGYEGETVCVNHMKLIHNFDYSQIRLKVTSECRGKLVNYIRYMTEKKKCMICGREYSTNMELEEHRVLEDHADLPPTDFYADERWKDPVLSNDGFIITAAKEEPR